jgi:hypothetical protein
MSTLASVLQRGTRAAQPLATAAAVGTLYYVTDEHVMERSSGSAWQSVSDAMTGDTGTGGLKGLVPAPGAGDAALNKFLKADGTWTVALVGSPDWDSTKIKANSDAVTNSGTLTDDTELTVAVVSGSSYVFEFTIVYESNNAANSIKWTFSLPGSANANQIMGDYLVQNGGGSATAVQAVGSSTTTWPSATGVTSAGIAVVDTKHIVRGRFTAVFNASGNVKFQFANTTIAVGRTATVRPGSTLKMKKLA